MTDFNANNFTKLSDTVEKKSGLERYNTILDVERHGALVGDINEKFFKAKTTKIIHETQFLRNTLSFKGEDDQNKAMRKSEISKVFVRTTTVKTKAAYAQIIEALFSDKAFPIKVTETPLPEGISDRAHLKTAIDEANQESAQPEQQPQAPQDQFGFEGDGRELAPDGLSFLGGLEEEYSDKEGEVIMAEGYQPGGININPAKIAARNIQKVIDDQLMETNAKTELRKSIFEACLLGTGIIKGPFNYNKTVSKWTKDESGELQYTPDTVRIPRLSHVSCWDFYPDPNARSPEELSYVIERHRMNANQLRNLKNMPHFSAEAIEETISEGGNYSSEGFEFNVQEHTQYQSELFEVREYWGFASRRDLEEYKIDIPDEAGDQVQINAWVSAGHLLRLVVNPFLPQRLPYLAFPYEVNPYEFWGTGVPELMEDNQQLMNGFARMAVDNLALAGNLVLAVDESVLVQGQPLDIYPGAVFKVHSGVQGDAIQAIKFPNTAPENLQMFDKFRQLADEATGISSFAHGQTGVMSPTRTASGMSMLLNNGSLNIKTVIRNIDDYLLQPLGQEYFHWNMQFNSQRMPEIVGDLEVVSTGSSSLQAKETRSAQLNTFLQLAGNPALAPLIKIPTVLKEFALTMDMDAEEILNTPDEAMIYARLMGQMNQQQQAGGTESLDPTLGVPQPGQAGFTGSDQTANQGPQGSPQAV